MRTRRIDPQFRARVAARNVCTCGVENKFSLAIVTATINRYESVGKRSYLSIIAIRIGRRRKKIAQKAACFVIKKTFPCSVVIFGSFLTTLCYFQSKLSELS